MKTPRLPPDDPVFPSQLKDVQLAEGGTGGFSFRPRLLEILASAGILAAGFLGASILIVTVVPIPPHVSPPMPFFHLVAWSLFVWVFVAVPFIPVALFRATRRYGHGTRAASAQGFIFAGLFWCALWCFATSGENLGTLNVTVVHTFFDFMLEGTWPTDRLLLAIPEAFVASAVGSELLIWLARPRPT